MNHDVAIHACTSRKLYISRTVGSAKLTDGCSRTGRSSAGVRAIVTLFTKEGRTRFKQRRNVGSMRRMAIGAIFFRRLMFPQEWPPLLCMTNETCFVDSVFLEQFRSGRTMRVVAIRTNHFPFFNRVTGVFIAICALFLMAGKTNFCLGFFVTNIVVNGMDFVT